MKHLKICVPPRVAETFIRRLHFSFGPFDERLSVVLQHAASVFRNLSFLEISLMSARGHWDSRSTRLHLQSMETIKFSARRLRVEYEHRTYGHRGRLDPFDAAVLAKFTLDDDSSVLASTVRRFSANVDGYAWERDMWPASTPIKDEIRWTIKEIVVRNKGHRPWTEAVQNNDWLYYKRGRMYIDVQTSIPDFSSRQLSLPETDSS